MNIPKDRSFSLDSVQCGGCRGFGCHKCDYKGWLTPKNHLNGKRCAYPACGDPLHPTCSRIYCNGKCQNNHAKLLFGRKAIKR